MTCRQCGQQYAYRPGLREIVMQEGPPEGKTALERRPEAPVPCPRCQAVPEPMAAQMRGWRRRMGLVWLLAGFALLAEGVLLVAEGVRGWRAVACGTAGIAAVVWGTDGRGWLQELLRRRQRSREREVCTRQELEARGGQELGPLVKEWERQKRTGSEVEGL